MKHAIFHYPKEFVTLPDYTAHAGQRVEVVRELSVESGDDVEPHNADMEIMFEIRAADGWIGHAFCSELEECT